MIDFIIEFWHAYTGPLWPLGAALLVVWLLLVLLAAWAEGIL